MGRVLLVTGGAGFIGSNFVHYYLDQHPDDIIVNLDALTYAGNLDNLKDLASCERHIFIKGNINDTVLLDDLFDRFKIAYILNFAAESHVDRSIENPSIFIETNVQGTQNLLAVALRHWGVKFEGGYAFPSDVRYLQVSTDEVYGALGKTGFFTEQTSLQPNSPYSASKASADLLVRAYEQTYGLPTLTTRCSNNYGPYQFPEKLIPLMIDRAQENGQLPVYGDGLQVRDWLHVSDHCAAIDMVLQKGRVGEVYNIGGNSEKSNLEIVTTILTALDKPEALITHVTDRLGHDRRYAIDNTKIVSELGWQPAYAFDKGIRDTIAWYKENTIWVNRIKTGDYRNKQASN